MFKNFIRHFGESLLVTVFGFIAAYFWAEHMAPGSGLKILFVTFFLAILEITLSFDNAVVNALILEKMTPKWQHRFLTWGILIAVFGMRFLFPVIIVSIFSQLNIIKTVMLAIEDVNRYTHYLHLAHAPLVAFGGAFLMMVGFEYFFSENKNFWLKKIEKTLANLNIRYLDILISLSAVFVTGLLVPEDIKNSVTTSGIIGIAVYLAVRYACSLLEKSQQKAISENVAKGAATGGFMMFMYLELIDASFSLDGVLGSFAISKDIVIITIGLAIGAMFVRSLTLVMVEKKTLKTYIYLSSGAHYAILTLAVIMLVSTVYEIPEVVTGTLGLIFVGASFISSLIENNKSVN